MTQHHFIFLLLLLPWFASGQIVKGKVYDNETTVSGVKITNKTRQTTTYSNNHGDFAIEAAVNDSITFSSLFHKTQTIIIKKSDFDDVIVVELKKDINQLNEVVLTPEKAKPFDEQEANTHINKQFKSDIQRNPHLYSKVSGNADFLAIAKLIGKLFKNKKPKDTITPPITIENFTQLFSTNAYFNEKLLKNDLNISEDYKHLFFEYCETQSLDSKLLQQEHRFLLLDALLKCSNDFLKIVSQHKKD